MKGRDIIAAVSLKNVDVESALRCIADRRIEEAMLNTLGTNAIDLAVTPVDLETEQARLRQGDGA